MDKEKIISIGAVVLVVGAIALYGFFGTKKSDKTPVVAEAPSVAKVNGVAIPKATFDTQLASALAAYKAQGIDVDKEENLTLVKNQVLNDLISNELVMQGIAKAGIKPTAQEVEVQFQAVLTQAGGADKLKTQLVTANLTEEQLRENLSRQLAVQAYLVKNVDISSITVTDAEIATFYKDNVSTQKDAPKLKDVSEQIKQQLLNTKQQELINKFVESLKAGAQIETSTI